MMMKYGISDVATMKAERMKAQILKVAREGRSTNPEHNQADTVKPPKE